MQTEANLRQQQVMDDFRRKQEAFFLQESSDDSSEVIVPVVKTATALVITRMRILKNVTSEYQKNAHGVENNENSDKTRPRTKGLQEELCALCHESICNTSKHGYPGMLGFVSFTNTLDHSIRQEEAGEYFAGGTGKTMMQQVGQ